MPQILRNQNNQVLVRCQAHVLPCHQQVRLFILWKTDCCLLFKAGAGATPISLLLWQLLVLSSECSFLSLDLLHFHVCRQRA